jgi:hypothetical protein
LVAIKGNIHCARGRIAAPLAKLTVD